MTRISAPRLSEKHVQKQVADFLRVIGGHVYELGHKRSKGRACPHCRGFVPNHDFSTRQTPGLPDLYAVVPRRELAEDALAMEQLKYTSWHPFWIECKAEGGRLSIDQTHFRTYCPMGTWHVVGGLDDVIAFLLDKGVISEKNVPHYRLPKATV